MSSVQIGGRSRNPRGALGRIIKAPQSFALETFRPTALSTGQSILLDIGGAQNSSTYTLRLSSDDIGTVDVSVTTDGSATAPELGDLFAAATAGSTASPALSSIARPGGTDVRLNVQQGAAAITATMTANPSSDVVLVDTPAAAGTAAPFGRFLALGDSASWGDNRTLSPLTAAAGPVTTVTIVVDSNGDTFADVYATPSGASPVTAVAYTAVTDTATTVPIAVTAYEAAFPLATVTGVTGTGVITIAHPIGFGVSGISATASGSSTISTAVAAGSASPDVALVCDPGDEVPSSIGASVTATAADSPILALRSLHGEVVVEAPGAVTYHGDVWIETADGANKGRPYAAASPSRVLQPGAHWVRLDEVDASLAILYVDTL